MNEDHLDRYARLLVKQALSLREGQLLDVWCELGHREFAYRVGKAAYALAAGQVRYRFSDPLEVAQLIRCARPDQITLFYLEERAWFIDVMRSRGALLILAGKTDPRALPDLQRTHPTNHQVLTLESSLLNRELIHRTIDQRLLPMAIAVCPTPAWAQQVFPDLTEQEAFERFWALVFQFIGADREDAPEHLEHTVRRLAKRAAALDHLAIREIHVQGGGNDLRVRFSDKIRWQSVGLSSVAGQQFLANVPSFEVFTTPHRHQTEGRLLASRPVRLNGGVIVEGLTLDFRNGKVVDFEAKSGADAFERSLEIDEGARYLGEFALVGQDSPIARCGHVFGHLLLDENAAAHVALGQSFAGALGLETSSPSQLEAAGCNRSAIHTDIPFGSPEVTVIATDTREGEVVLLERGFWAGRLEED